MKVYLILVMVCLVFAGCASWKETIYGPIPQGKNFALGEFIGSDPAIGKIFKSTVEDEFTKAGFIFENNKPDFYLSGVASQKGSAAWATIEANWLICLSDTQKKEIAKVRYEISNDLIYGATSPYRISKKMSKRVLDILNARQTGSVR